MNFKLPKLQVFLNGDKKTDETDATKNIHVIGGHAIVSNDIIAIVNLREYVKRELKINDDNDLQELSQIIDWMNYKSFTKEFWSELTSEKIVSLLDDGLEITHQSYTKHLNYLDNDADPERAYQLTKDNINRNEIEMSRFALSGEHLSLISKGFASEMKGDNLIFKLSGTGNAIMFSLQRRDYIFGVIPEHFDSSMDLAAFITSEGLFELLRAKEFNQ
jgi:hypothetical protein